MRVMGERELALFPGTALGSVAPRFDYRSERGAQVCVRLSVHIAGRGHVCASVREACRRLRSFWAVRIKVACSGRPCSLSPHASMDCLWACSCKRAQGNLN
jgi:Biotin-protein ligase, N terminal